MVMCSAIILFFVTLTLIVSVPGMFGWPQGAHVGTCPSMTPVHAVSAQESKPPFTVTPSKMTYGPGENLTVVLQSTDPANTEFRGLMLQARAFNNTPVGVFTLPEGVLVQTLDCMGNNKSGVTHKKGFSKSTLTVTWTAPNQSEGTVTFTATFVRTQYVFWIFVTSGEVMFVDPDATTEPEVVTSPTTPQSTVGDSGSDRLLTATVYMAGCLLAAILALQCTTL